MAVLSLIALGFAPGFFWLWVVRCQDDLEPEPLKLVLWVFALGAFGVFPALLLEFAVDWGVYDSTVVAPVVEEGVKFLVILLFVYPNKEFNEPIDGIVYAGAAALGFASLENVLYLFRSHPAPEQLLKLPWEISLPEPVLSVFTVRAIFAVPGHVLDSAIWGYALGRAKIGPARWPPLLVGLALLGAMTTHGVYNLIAGQTLAWMAGDPELWASVFISFACLTWFFFWIYLADAERRSPFRKGAPGSVSETVLPEEEG